MVKKEKRSVERDYKFYDSPEIVWRKINENKIPYRRTPIKLQTRDLALMSLLYLTGARITEILGGTTIGGKLPPITKDQFFLEGDFLLIRLLPIIKRHHKKITHYLDYPKRNEIKAPRLGFLANFTNSVIKWLRYLEDPRAPVFGISRERAYQIIRQTTGEFPHYFREMCFKFYRRVYRGDIQKLRHFSGHARIDNLVRYLEEIGIEEEDYLLSYGVVQ